ncbi:MAG: GtrA family protein [Pseudomonadota bacterium]
MVKKTLKRVARSPSDRATFVRFSLVGVCMGVIDVGMLYLLKEQPLLNLYTARVLSYSTGLVAGYLLNRYFTFHHLDSGRVMWREFVRFFGVHWTGGLINYAVYSLVIVAGMRTGLSPGWEALWPLFAVWVGGVVGLCFNFFVGRRLVFGAGSGADAG